jgi:hypothetical protein
MFHRSRQGVLRAMFVVAGAMCAMAITAAAQNAGKPATTVAAPPAPTPAAMQTAKRVFLGNAGVDGNSLQAFRQSGDMNQAYNRLYAAMKSWGRYELVGSPAEADLVFEISFAAPLVGTEKMLWAVPYLRLEILDAKSHFLLWTIVEPVQPANRKSTWESNFNTGVTSLVNELKNVTGDAPVPSK